MKTTLRIAKLELNSLLYSPLAWLILTGFSIYTGTTMIPNIAKQVLRQGLHNLDADRSLTGTVFSLFPISLFPVAIPVIMILVPLMVMGVLSRESASGTIKLLYSSPIKVRSIVLGKYLASMVLVFMLTGVFFIAIVIGQLTIENFDFLHMLTGLLGLFLMVATVTAITLYVSAFTSYPVVDAIVTITIVYGLSIIYPLVRDIPVIGPTFYWLVPELQTSSAVDGLLMSKNIGYFLVITGMFLALAYFKMILKRQTRSAKRTTRLKMLGTVVSSMVLIYVLIQPAFTIHKDMTRNQENVLTPTSKRVLAPLKDQPITIVKYSEAFTRGNGARRISGRTREQDRTFGKYLLEFPQIKFEYKFFYRESSVKQLGSRGMYGLRADMTIEEALDTISFQFGIPVTDMVPLDELDLDREIIENYRNTYNFFVVKSEAKTAPLTAEFSGGGFSRPDERDITTAFKALIDDDFLMGVVSGHGERTIADAVDPKSLSSVFTNVQEHFSFTNNGISMKPISLANEVPAEIDILTIADPQSAYTAQEIAHFQEFVDRGGDVLLLSAPGKAEIMNPLLEYLGVAQRTGQVYTDDPNVNAHFVYAKIEEDSWFKEKMGFSFPIAFMPDVAALKVTEDKGFTTTTLISTDESKTWVDEKVRPTAPAMNTQSGFGSNGMMRPGGSGQGGRPRGMRPSQGGQRPVGRPQGRGADPFTTAPKVEEQTFDSAINQKEKLTLAMSLERKVVAKDQQIIVWGGIDALSNERQIGKAPGDVQVTNITLGKPIINYMTQGEYPLDIQGMEMKDTRTIIPFEMLWLLRLFMYFLLPGTFLFFGVKMMVKRMRS